ncbi:PIR protein [Plasmodium ovale]|uniref:PIR protein n=2 Tax=Plasmodium ovale TaxID=36330 RepID=A0A1D3JE79_PLAOA|nr:PIR protein [Plasmodium ovale]
MASHIGEKMYGYTSLFPKYSEIFEKETIYEETMKGIYCHNTEKYLESEYAIDIEPCARVSMYLNHLKSMYKQDYIEDGCKILNFWLNDLVQEKQNSGYSTLKLYEGLVKMNIDNSYLESDICSGYIEHIDNKIFKKVKELHDLYNKFYKLKNGTTSPTFNICNCADECATLYMTFENKCDGSSTYYFCNELENFRKLYNEHMKSVTTCEPLKKYLPSFQKSDISVFILTSLIIIFLLSFALFVTYKFTPYGLVLRSLVSRKTRIWDNMDKKSHQAMHTSENKNINSKKVSYHVAYHSV